MTKNVLFLLGLLLTSTPAQSATFVVNSTADISDNLIGDGICDSGSGLCTLRAAIQEANVPTNTFDIVTFNIGGVDQRIVLASELPAITEPVRIDGSTQPGASCGDLWAGAVPTWKVVIDGNGSLWNGFVLNAPNTIIKGLEIENFGDAIALTTAGIKIQCNFIHSNSNSGVTVNGGTFPVSDLTIGGLAAGDGNVISGNTIGFKTNGNRVETALIAGNFVGTDATGDSAFANTDAGINFHDGAAHIVITRNLISGNQIGVRLKGTGSAITDVTITSNYVGLNRSGTFAIGNTQYGLLFGSGFGVHESIIGGPNPLDRNIISGNAAGITLLDPVDINNTIQGNYIGLNAAGTDVIPGGDGISDTGTGTLIVRNVVAGSTTLSAGIRLQGTGAVVQENYIGTDPTGNSSNPSFGNCWGIFVIGSQNLIGASLGGGVGNTIGHSSCSFGGLPVGSGILIQGIFGGGHNNSVRGNTIGVGADGISAIPNEHGVLIFGSTTTGNKIEGNVIANNFFTGVLLAGDPSGGVGPAGSGNALLGNSIYSNDVGIDISANPTVFFDGPTPNDLGDADTGPNGIQNFPVLTSATKKGRNVRVTGILSSLPRQSYRLEFFHSPSGSLSGGRTFLDSIKVKTNRAGQKKFTKRLVLLETSGVITATASAIEGELFSTSEFSPSVAIVP